MDGDDATTTTDKPVKSSPSQRSTEAASAQHEAYVQLIGLSTVRHSTLDYAIRLLISKLASVNSTTGETFMQRQSTKQLLSILKRLIDKQVSPLRESLLDFRKRVYEVNERRNDVVHALWTFDHLGRGSRAHRLRTVPPAELEELPDQELKELLKLNHDFGRLIGHAFGLLDDLENIHPK